MGIRGGLLCAAVAAFGLAGCGSDSTTSTVATSTDRGTLVQNPPFRIASLDAADFQAQLAATSSGQQLLELTGNPTCGVDFYYLNFWTVDAQNNPTESSGALMVPTGAGATCSGPRPIVLYAHGTNPNKLLNIADITNTSNTEGALIAAMFAALAGEPAGASGIAASAPCALATSPRFAYARPRTNGSDGLTAEPSFSARISCHCPAAASWRASITTLFSRRATATASAA